MSDLIDDDATSAIIDDDDEEDDEAEFVETLSEYEETAPRTPRTPRVMRPRKPKPTCTTDDFVSMGSPGGATESRSMESAVQEEQKMKGLSILSEMLTGTDLSLQEISVPSHHPARAEMKEPNDIGRLLPPHILQPSKRLQMPPNQQRRLATR